MTKSRLRSCVLNVALSVTCGCVSAAQGNSTTTIKSCAEAARFVENGHPSHKQGAALDYLRRCGQVGAAATALALRESRNELDRKSLSTLYHSIDWWRDAAIMNEALQLTGDPGASVPSRVFAMSHLLSLLNPGRIYDYEAMIESTTSGHIPCVRGSVTYPEYSIGRPLPSDYATQIEAVFRKLMSDTSAPRQVRNAASCVDF